jgi:hypothetical protein
VRSNNDSDGSGCALERRLMRPWQRVGIAKRQPRDLRARTTHHRHGLRIVVERCGDSGHRLVPIIARRARQRRQRVQRRAPRSMAGRRSRAPIDGRRR